MGLLLRVHVNAADVPDREGAKTLLAGVKAQFPRLSMLWADQGYNGAPFAAWVRAHLGCTLEITSQPDKSFWLPVGAKPPTVTRRPIQPRRWVVERTLAWLGRNRRLAKDYEGLPVTDEALITLSMVRLMLRRLIN